jgi:hypothetical protein
MDDYHPRMKLPRLSATSGWRSRRASAGFLLHAGSALEWLAPDVLAAPWWKVL